ncbi:2-dehydro-3-deoxyphosphooctonate aldolase [Endomicrobiia bacterium]|nr:2-dehydro-3-deoxyphosphooctonate aldolase [Endomicrobiia bacterium]GHT66045.1 2-dehydro-3-deoxyphosphooctonate aldolase [Endomicrobiia bacterium]GHT70358.1 2-dehydro-3-deoxyphosphooctonate aldolase [Endomicrobiia bacterium]GHT75461.1 2-dehydro-3-deoxyphosphooctonate aldolase [Endomicrobiia bacterium]
MQNKRVKIGRNIVLANDKPFVVIAGPCVIESEKHALTLAANLKTITNKLKISFIFKASYDKANRSSGCSYRGPGIEEGLKVLAKIKKELNLPVITDVHTESHAPSAAKIVDFLQIPAFLSRQTDLIKACALTGKPINIKKGQFLAPEDMFNVVKKAESFGSKNLSLTERGASFGYHNLVVDFRGLEIMKQTGYPVIFDATHSVQLPGGQGTCSGGNVEFIAPLSKAAAAVGVAALFLEVHENPDKALSDGANSLNLRYFEQLLKDIKNIDRVIK